MDKIIIKLNKNQILNKNVWESLKNGHIYLINLSTDQRKQYEFIKELSKNLLAKNYDLNSTSSWIKRTFYGYYIRLHCEIAGIYCYTKINVNKNKATLSLSNSCTNIKSLLNLLFYTNMVAQTKKSDFYKLSRIRTVLEQNNINNKLDLEQKYLFF